MDNLTHGLAGLLLAEAALAWRPQENGLPGRGLRLATCAASIAANNLPDLDFLYTGISQPRPLGYLLHHRGHTHTLVAGVLFAALTFAVTLAALRVFRVATTRADRSRLLALSLVGPVVHIGMDFTNNYGVHPFWPLHDAWFYGDSVFIVEPWLWVAMLPVLAYRAEGSIGRATLGILSVAGLALTWGVSLVPWGAALALTVGAALATFSCSRLSSRARVAQGLIATIGVVLVFALASRLAEARAAAAMQIEEGELRAGTAVVDIIVTPAPANPLCATALLLGMRGETYFVRKAVVASVPGLLPAARCRVEPSESTARFAPLAASRSRAVTWIGEWSAPRPEFEQLLRKNCQVNALLRFARAPYWLRSPNGWTAGDLRYDREPELGFAELATTERPQDCPAWVPPWTPPRGDLFEP